MDGSAWLWRHALGIVAAALCVAGVACWVLSAFLQHTYATVSNWLFIAAYALVIAATAVLAVHVHLRQTRRGRAWR